MAVDLLAVGVTTALSWRDYAVDRHTLISFGLLVALGVLASEGSRRIERLRRRLTATPHVNLTSVWTLAASVVLPPPFAAGVVIVLYGHLWWRSWRATHIPVYRLVFNVSGVLLSVAGAATVAGWRLAHVTVPPRGLVDAAGVAAVIVVYSVINLGLVATAVFLAGDRRRRSLRDAVGTWSETAIEYGTLCLGMVTAWMLRAPWALITLPFPLYLVHRAGQVGGLELAVTTDPDTGLLNSTAWRSWVERECDRARRLSTSLGVVVVEVDGLTRIAALHGRDVAERVLRAVADVARGSVRSEDPRGRIGSSELVVALPDTDLAGAAAVAQRLCQAVRGVQVDLCRDPTHAPDPGRPLAVTASIGVAIYPAAGDALDDVLAAATAVLYTAQASGGDQVCVAEGGPMPRRVHRPQPGESLPRHPDIQSA